MIYVYGIVKKSKSNLDGIKGFSPVSFIDYNDTSAVVSSVGEKFSQEEIDKNVKNIKWLAANAPIHENVVEGIMKTTTIIPMKFCTIFNSEDTVRKTLKENYPNFIESLERLNDKIEVGVKIYIDSNTMKNELRGKHQEIKKLEEEKKEQASGKAYFTEQKIDMLLKQAVREKSVTQSKEISGKLKRLAVESKENALWDKKMTGKHMLLNSVFLIGKQDIGKFTKDVETVKKDYSGLDFQIAGPFPPYNFC
jgi:hypothetical protein